ncbi:hypothetical protein GCM10010390_41030 [Streptomyces mordarskii]|uniref:Uncharacterized protein n=1 Tax=Streptomyces mordarskii TaxID=1226758 RepID=A0ABP3N704_9ACTN
MAVYDGVGGQQVVGLREVIGHFRSFVWGGVEVTCWGGRAGRGGRLRRACPHPAPSRNPGLRPQAPAPQTPEGLELLLTPEGQAFPEGLGVLLKRRRGWS